MGRTVTLDGQFRYSNNRNNTDSYSNTALVSPVRPLDWAFDGTYVDPETGETKPYSVLRYLRSVAPSSSYTLRGEFTYTEPVSKYAQLSLQYRASYEHQERDKKSYITGDDFSIAGLPYEPSLSNTYESNYLTQRVGPGFRYSKERNTFVANVYYQRASLLSLIHISEPTRLL